MQKWAKGKVDEQLARQSHQLQYQKILKIHGTVEFQVYGSKKITLKKRMQFPMRLNAT